MVRVIVAGDSLDTLRGENGEEEELTFDKQRSAADQDRITGPLRQLDLFLSQVASSVKVDLMPGSLDPTNFTIPQVRLLLSSRTRLFVGVFVFVFL